MTPAAAVAAVVAVTLFVGSIALLRIWLGQEAWKEAIEYGDKLGVFPLPDESLEDFRSRIRRKSRSSAVDMALLHDAMNRVVPKGAYVYVRSEPGKLVFKVAGKTLTNEQRAMVRHEAELLSPKNVEIEIVNRGRSS